MPVSKERAVNDAEKRVGAARGRLQGTWIEEEILVQAKPGDAPEKRKGTRKWVVEGDHVAVDEPLLDASGRLAGSAGARPAHDQEAVLFLNTAGADRIAQEKPLPVDLAIIPGSLAPAPDGARWRTMQGILKLDGDRLTVCLRVTGAPRPIGFARDEIGNTLVIGLRKAKAAGKVTRPSPAEEFKAILVAQKKGYEDFGRAYRAAKSDAERLEVMKRLGDQANPNTFALRVLRIIQKNPGDPVVQEASQWLCVHDAGFMELGLRTVSEHWMHRPELATFCAWASHPGGREFLCRALAGNPSRGVQGTARYVLASSHLEMARVFADKHWPDAASAEKAKAEKLLDEVVKHYPDVVFAGKRLGDLAADELFKLRRLAPGQPAPETAGEDLEGKSLKLSDFRGKVVVLSFWTSDCVPCMHMVPHERDLVKRLRDKPFVLLGVSGDSDRMTAANTARKKGMVWRSWWDGEKRPIMAAWKVNGWPTVYVLDHRGVIRYVGVQDHALDQAVDSLVKELEAEKQPRVRP